MENHWDRQSFVQKNAIITKLTDEVKVMQDAANATETLIREQIAKHPVILYMKGTPQFPQCGFSARAIEALSQIGRPFAYVNILENPDIRATLPKIANWPTFPQLWVAGELIGGSDIILDMFQKGELQPLIQDNSPAQA
jgi:monothiol glutaredoxin